MTADAHGFHGYVGVQRCGVIALPADLRQRLHLDEPGSQVAITERADSVIELRPALRVPADQAWFWTEQWQLREREVDEHVATGRCASTRPASASSPTSATSTPESEIRDNPPQ